MFMGLNERLACFQRKPDMILNMMNRVPEISCRTRGSWARAMGVLLSLSIAPMAIAQAPSTGPAGDTAVLKPGLELADVPGVQAGMSVDALLDVAAKAVQSGGFADAQKILDAVIKQDRENVRALALQASSY